ncbi:BlaI/MecI/CopY family transcriptional regulator [Dyadobacter sp. CY261]|uniref:BlaI/MecI/CopY family transcriptional regulator n=1 Tax=Dyadobacter sp. CY261 TaxID=2907203 RepID=UPI001F480DBF|nr:BlaI/MecI/CopY family transcriptional regulator [Dyadobacter sp. CY261]MCF0073484.1 BlaI/MecI/CopY family transcriptional regulator [Dyadobacter sp. CY261]
MNEKNEPTKAELDILTILWKHGPSTVRFVHDQLNAFKEVNYTTTLKQMQLMAEKGLLRRDESSMKHIYEAIEEEKKTKSLLLDRFVDHIYGGSASNLVMQLLDNKKASKAELDEIRAVLDQLERKNS